MPGASLRRPLLLLLSLLACLGVRAGAQSASPADMTGTWTIEASMTIERAAQRLRCASSWRRCGGGARRVAVELSSIGARHQQRAGGLIYLDSAADRTAPDDVASVQIATAQPSPADRRSMAAFRAWQKRVMGIVMPESELRESTAIMSDGQIGRSRTPRFVFDAMAAGVRAPDYRSIRVPALAIYSRPYASVAEARAANVWNAAQFPDADEAAVSTLFSALQKRIDAEAGHFEREVTGARTIVLPGADHYNFISNADDVLREIRGFVQALDRTK